MYISPKFIFVYISDLKLLCVGETDNGIEGCHSGIEVSKHSYLCNFLILISKFTCD